MVDFMSKVGNNTGNKPGISLPSAQSGTGEKLRKAIVVTPTPPAANDGTKIPKDGLGGLFNMPYQPVKPEDISDGLFNMPYKPVKPENGPLAGLFGEAPEDLSSFDEAKDKTIDYLINILKGNRASGEYDRSLSREDLELLIKDQKAELQKGGQSKQRKEVLEGSLASAEIMLEKFDIFDRAANVVGEADGKISEMDIRAVASQDGNPDTLTSFDILQTRIENTHNNKNNKQR